MEGRQRLVRWLSKVLTSVLFISSGLGGFFYWIVNFTILEPWIFNFWGMFSITKVFWTDPEMLAGGRFYAQKKFGNSIVEQLDWNSLVEKSEHNMSILRNNIDIAEENLKQRIIDTSWSGVLKRWVGGCLPLSRFEKVCIGIGGGVFIIAGKHFVEAGLYRVIYDSLNWVGAQRRVSMFYNGVTSKEGLGIEESVAQMESAIFRVSENYAVNLYNIKSQQIELDLLQRVVKWQRMKIARKWKARGELDAEQRGVNLNINIFERASLYKMIRTKVAEEMRPLGPPTILESRNESLVLVRNLNNNICKDQAHLKELQDCLFALRSSYSVNKSSVLFDIF